MTEKRKMPVRTQRIELAGEFEGWDFTGRINPKMSTLDDISSGIFRRITAGLAEVVLDWNFVDENGAPLPSPAQLREAGQDQAAVEAAVGELPLDLTMAVAKAISEAITVIPPN